MRAVSLWSVGPHHSIKNISISFRSCLTLQAISSQMHFVAYGLVLSGRCKSSSAPCGNCLCLHRWEACELGEISQEAKPLRGSWTGLGKSWAPQGNRGVFIAETHEIRLHLNGNRLWERRAAKSLRFSVRLRVASDPFANLGGSSSVWTSAHWVQSMNGAWLYFTTSSKCC